MNFAVIMSPTQEGIAAFISICIFAKERLNNVFSKMLGKGIFPIHSVRFI